MATKGDLCKISLITPSCTDIGEKVALSRRIEKHWRLIGSSLPHQKEKDIDLTALIGWGQVNGGNVLKVGGESKNS